MVLKKPLRNFFPNFKTVMKLVPTRVELKKLASPEALFRTKTLQFIVDKSMNKITFREYIQKLYGIEVKKVNSANLPGKKLRKLNGRGYSQRPDFKKMFITTPNWVQVPYAPRARSEFEHAIEHDDTDYSKNFSRVTMPKILRQRVKAANQRKKNRYDPTDDPVYNRKAPIRVPRNPRED